LYIIIIIISYAWCVFVCVCVFPCLFVCLYVHVFVCECVCVSARGRVYMYTCLYVYI